MQIKSLDWRFYLACFAILAFCLFAPACGCSGGAVCVSGSGNVVGPGSPIPTPKPVTSATPDACETTRVDVGFHSGAQLPFVALGATEQLDVTPYGPGGATPKGCDVSREPTTVSLTPTICSVLGSGYNPFVKGLRVGTCGISATLTWDNKPVTGIFTVEIR